MTNFRAVQPSPAQSAHGIFARPDTATRRPLSEPGVIRRVAPFSGAGLIAVGLASLPPAPASPRALAAGAALIVILILSAITVPWARFSDAWQGAVPLCGFVAIGLLRHGEGGATSGYSPTVMLPVLWIALYGSRGQLRLAIVGTALTFVVPLTLVGPPMYPRAGWRESVLWIVIAVLAGHASQTLVDHSRQRTADVGALGSVTRALTTGADPRDELTAAAQLVTGAAFCILIEPQEDGTLTATSGTAGIELAAVRIDPRAEVSATAEVWRTGARIYIGDVSTDPRASSRLAAHTGARAVLLQPVLRDGQCTGVLIVGFTKSRQAVPEQALYMVELVAAEIAAAIDRADLVALLAAQARTDPLTGAANRRSGDEQMVRELARAQRTADPLTVALLDMDHFKAYNDAHGHSAGDELLRDVVAAIRAELRTGDVIARWGGEEFALALPGCDLQEAQRAATRFLQVVPGGQSASIGLTQAAAGDTPRSLVARADRALYVAKDAGRNRVHAVAAPTSPSSLLQA